MGQPTPPTPTPPADPGATPPAAPPTPPSQPPATPPATGDPAADAMNSDAGKKALAELRAENKTLADRLKALEPLGKLAEALQVKPEPGKTDTQTLTEQIARMQKDLADERVGRLRLEVAADKGLTPQQAARLTGSTRDELAADADALKALFPAANGGAPGTPGTPVPDPSQGSRPGVTQLEAQLAEANKAGNTREAIRLKTLIAAQKRSS